MFFFSDNPIALFLALVITIIILKAILEKHKWFSGKPAHTIPLLIIIAILLLGYKSILSIISFATPFLALLIIFLFFLGAVYYMLGVPRSNIAPMMKSVGTLKVTIIILVICVFALAGSRIYGQHLLEEKSVSLGDVLMTQEETVEVDFSKVITPAAMGYVFLFLIIALLFFFVAIYGT